MTAESEKLLSAEQAVQDLLTNLERLQQETTSYAEAGTALAETRGNVAQLVSGIQSITQQASSVFKTLGEVGTPQIIGKLEQVEGKLNDVVTGNRAELAQVARQLTSLEQAHEVLSKAVTGRFAELSQILRQLTKLEKADETLSKTLTSGLAELAQLTKQVAKAIRDGIAGEIEARANEQAKRLDEALAQARGENRRRHRLLVTVLVVNMMLSAGALILSIFAIR